MYQARDGRVVFSFRYCFATEKAEQVWTSLQDDPAVDTLHFSKCSNRVEVVLDANATTQEFQRYWNRLVAGVAASLGRSTQPDHTELEPLPVKTSESENKLASLLSLSKPSSEVENVQLPRPSKPRLPTATPKNPRPRKIDSGDSLTVQPKTPTRHFERNQKICSAYAQGVAVVELAQRFNLGTQSIYLILSNNKKTKAVET